MISGNTSTYLIVWHVEIFFSNDVDHEGTKVMGQ